MTTQTTINGLRVASELAAFLNEKVLPNIEVDTAEFWSGFEALIDDLTPRNTELLAKRDLLQGKIDTWHRQNSATDFDAAAYKRFLQDIGYLLPVGADFAVTTEKVDAEIALQAGPQLVVPVKNARFALNAANARWGSLYDALYGTDVIPETDGAERRGAYNPLRGARVIDYARDFLDSACPLVDGSHQQATAYSVRDGQLIVQCGDTETALAQGTGFCGYTGKPGEPDSILLVNNQLHLELMFERDSEIGEADHAGMSDIVLESALTTIQDCEDSVAAVDAEDKLDVYKNWFGLMQGDLSVSFAKADGTTTRVLNTDRLFIAPDGSSFRLPGRSLLLVRNVGHLMRNETIIDSRGEEIYEGIMDAVVTSAIGALDIRKRNLFTNSRQGSIYIVKPKMHGPEEVQFCCDLFGRVEQLLSLDANTIKMGIMDEERRTTVNLKECIRAASSRVVFINTGFLDRTGDEIHTSMEAGAVIPKTQMKGAAWISAYEDNNVDVGLACGLRGRAQIGKGMWAMPDLMARMVEEKIAHPLSGANTAWVPSPTAATLHVMHYHRVNVAQVQKELMGREAANVDAILTIPFVKDIAELSAAQITEELDNSAQSILGYVVRWIDHGVGCSKVPDIHNIGLMEDRATLRISSQQLANWLHHGVCSKKQVQESLQRMAAVVDEQNAADPSYQAMAGNYENSIAFAAASDLVFKGTQQVNGYTEPLLHQRRIEKKAADK